MVSCHACFLGTNPVPGLPEAQAAWCVNVSCMQAVSEALSEFLSEASISGRQRVKTEEVVIDAAYRSVICTQACP